MSLLEVNEAAELIGENVDPEANIIFGADIDEAMGDALRITVIATGFDRTDRSGGAQVIPGYGGFGTFRSPYGSVGMGAGPQQPVMQPQPQMMQQQPQMAQPQPQPFPTQPQYQQQQQPMRPNPNQPQYTSASYAPRPSDHGGRTGCRADSPATAEPQSGYGGKRYPPRLSGKAKKQTGCSRFSTEPVI